LFYKNHSVNFNMIPYKNRYTCLLLFLLLTNPCKSVETSMAFRHFSTEDGLCESSVDIILQDHMGFMWFGASKGLNRFDGHKFATYRNNLKDTTSLSGNWISAIYEDRQKNLWIGTRDGGLNLYNRYQNSFTRLKHHQTDSLQLEYDIKFIMEDYDNRLWIAFYNSLEIFDREKMCYSPYRRWKEIQEILGDFEIMFLYMDKEGLLWIGTSDKGLIALDIETDTFEHYEHHENDLKSLSHNYVWTLTEDGYGNLWIGTYGGGLNLFDRDRRVFHRFQHDPLDENSIGSNYIFTLHFDQDSTLWIGTEDSGLNKLRIKSQPMNVQKLSFQKYKHDKNNKYGLSSNNIRFIYHDMQENFWLSTYKGGLNLYARYSKPFKHIYSEPNNEKSLSNNMVNCIFEDREGFIWISTDGGGLNLFHRETNSFTTFLYSPEDPFSLSHNHVISTCEDRDGNLWIGTWGGLNQLDKNTNKFIRFEHDPMNENSLCNNNIDFIMNDSRNLLWICLINGLDVFDLNQKKFYHIHADKNSPTGLSNRQVTTAFEDSRGNVWIGTERGINVLDKENVLNYRFSFKHYLDGTDDPDDPNGKVIRNFYESQNRDIWIATEEGVYRYSPATKSFECFTVQDGLPSNGIMAILEDDLGNLWISTLSGLSKFNPETRQFTNFVLSDGLQSNEFYVGAIKSRTGEMYFGGINGFNVFHPEKFYSNPEPPPIVITDFFINNVSIPMGHFIENSNKNNSSQDFIPTLKIRPENNAFSFEFAALDYTNPKKHQFAYILEGFNADWIYTDANRRLATYTTLPAGTYQFRVRGCNSDGVWNEDGGLVYVHVIPPFIKSNWALAIYIILGLAVLYVLRHIIVIKIKYNAELALDEMKLKFFTNITHEFRTPLTLIMGPLEKLLSPEKKLLAQKREQYYQIILRNSQRLLRLISQIMDVQKIDKGKMKLNISQMDIVKFINEIFSSFKYLAESRHINFHFSANQEQIITNCDPEKLDKIIYNLISNAFKYTPHVGEIRISISLYQSSKEFYDQLGDTNHIKLNQSLRKSAQFIAITVKDSGKGMSKQQEQHIFDLFYQGSQGVVSGHQGTGIGLALTKELVALHDGQIFVKTREDQGSEFTVILPLIEESVVSAAVDKSYIHDEIVDQVGLNPCSPEEPEDVDFIKASPLILIVEDDTDLRFFIREQL